MNIIWIAPPAAGKGTYSSLLKEKYGFNHISAGDALREQVSLGTEIGKEVKEIIEKGEMVDDNLMKRLIEAKLKTLDLSVPFMMDGYPRKINQAHDYEEILKKLNIDVDKVIYIDIDKETGLKRVLGRRTCPKCKKGYNVLTGYNKPKEEELCDDCHVKLEQRTDDNKESYEKRYDVYKEETKPVIEYFDSLGKLITIDGKVEPEKMLDSLMARLGVNND